jgi:ligand-binding sensor domain-containing protein
VNVTTGEKRIRDLTVSGLRGASGILLLCVIHVSCALAADSPARDFQNILTQGGDALVADLKFTHLTTNDGLSQGYVTAILQDRRGFMWYATRDGLNRYDGNAFVV